MKPLIATKNKTRLTNPTKAVVLLSSYGKKRKACVISPKKHNNPTINPSRPSDRLFLSSSRRRRGREGSRLALSRAEEIFRRRRARKRAGRKRNGKRTRAHPGINICPRALEALPFFFLPPCRARIGRGDASMIFREGWFYCDLILIRVSIVTLTRKAR